MLPMTQNLHVFRDPPLDGPTNMARDEHLLYSLPTQPAALRLYAWSEPTISLGYFQPFSQIQSLPDPLNTLAVVRRCTGGGAILHDRELTYCLVLSETQPLARRPPVELYRAVHTCWRDALAVAGVETSLAPDSLPLPTPRSGPFFCFARPGQTDLLLHGEKLLGSSQRRIPGGVMQHGSLILGRRFDAHPGAHLGDPDSREMTCWADAFVARLAAALDLAPTPTSLDAAQLADVATRRSVYASAAWTRRR
ncbi:MAG: Octanoyltransferase LipM [Phycisphaerae bacterium]|nr:Octanoyltransferase LipM [Phycisphaerae bacterium]